MSAQHQESAFPFAEGHFVSSGMSLRDYFAAQTVTGASVDGNANQFARWAYEVADAMLKAREA